MAGSARTVYGVINKGYSAAGYSKFNRTNRMVAVMEIAMVA